MPTYNYIVKKGIANMKKSFYEYSQNNNNGEKSKESNQKFSQMFNEQKMNQQAGFDHQNSNFAGRNSGFNRQNFNQNFAGQNNFNQTEFKNQNADKTNIEDTLNKYKNMSQGELLSNLYSEVAKQKQQGTFDVRRLENAISSLGGILTPEQQKNMKEMLNKLK